MKREPIDISDGIWTFYDSWAAFPFNRHQEPNRSIVGEFRISLDHPDGSSYGSFGLVFYQFHSDGRMPHSARLEAFEDSWQALTSTDLMDRLAALAQETDDQSPDAVRAVLLDMGMIDKTAELRGDHPSYCDQCHGTGVLDGIAPSDRAVQGR